MTGASMYTPIVDIIIFHKFSICFDVKQIAYIHAIKNLYFYESISIFFATNFGSD
ncbi:hypothetical protein ACJX0J_025754, partial [Zea mays]